MKRIVTAVTLLILLSLVCGCTSHSVTETPTENGDSSIIGTVDGEAITAEELDYFMKICRASVISQLAADYGAEDVASIPAGVFDGKSFDEILREESFNRAVDAKIVFLLLKENGVYDDISFSSFRERMLEYNALHSVNDNSAGLSQIDENDFYSYYLKTGRIELESIFGTAYEEKLDARAGQAETVYYGVKDGN